MANPQRRNPTLLRVAIAALLVSGVATWAAIFLSDMQPWNWIAMAIQFVSLLIGLVYLVRFIRGQRDDYWRERGRDPKDPTKPVRNEPTND